MAKPRPARSLVPLREPGLLRRGAASSRRGARRRDRRRARRRRADPGARRRQAGRDDAGVDPRGVARGERERRCVGVIAWMHTFSPAKMWIAGLGRAPEAAPPPAHAVQPRAAVGRDRHGLHEPEPVGARRPRVRVHRDADAARAARRSSATGSEPAVLERIGAWARAACGWHEPQRLRVARFGDNMRQVAVTEGDKVEAQIRLGVAVDGYGVGELADAVRRRPRRRGRAARRRVRGGLRPRARALRAGGDAARLAARCGADRGRPARRSSTRGGVPGVHRHLRGPRTGCGSCRASPSSG